ncbi:peptidoglycan/xylan/chitin deacetylase (PgdA/CDA1 family) [Nonomuraea polychroma]|uniref:Peptidoglycan/xylan/chitin deacetylase (PgdA/CDA1 family) n=1 Tax=Nonomuraea polychroma TaxID=46176 RepID=A0A438MPB4_9ACTN|nr:polysaccharide deacetylase family protein [Nonomuraea polychroma]RVX47256.1 peptidoglycan/xylan/chitin deacetylase (PgdA/CDA1 family) [Nonomuraea polychroma]
MRLPISSGLGVLAVAVLLTGCDSQPDTAKMADAKPKAAKVVDKAAKAKAAAKVKANELGQIPVLMFHRVIEKPATTDDRTPQQFRADLERLVKEDYVPITAAELVSGKIDIPAGKHPVVLTFDDSSPSQLTLNEMGAPQKDTAVAILQDVAAKNPGFRPVATFYVTRDMFGKTSREEQTQMLVWLKDNGFDIGNHTRDHFDLRTRSHEQVEEQIGTIGQQITSLSSVKPATIALPYGNQPRKKDWAMRGKHYNHQGAFLAGYTPAPAPFSKAFDPAGIPRIKVMEKKGDCAQFCSHAWLDWLKNNPDMRYTSDGDASTVAYPKFKSPYLRKAFTKWSLPY